MRNDDRPRLADEGSAAPEPLRAALRQARALTPAPATIAAVAARLGPLLDAPLPGPTGGGGGGGSAPQGFAGSPSPAPAGAAGGLKAGGLIGAALVVAAVGGLVVWRATRPPAAPDAPLVAAPASASAAPPAAGGAASRPGPAAGTPASVPSASASHRAAPASARAAASLRPPPARAARPAPAAGATGSPPATTTPPPPSELELLARARRLVASAPARALGITRQHAELHPRGNLAQEREVIAIEALMRLGRGVEARQRAATFHARFPGSIHRAAVNALVGSAPGRGHAPDRPDR